MSAIRLLGVGILFAIALPQHGGSWSSPASPSQANTLPASIAAPQGAAPNGDKKVAMASNGAESARLRALRTNETDLFKNLPDLPRSCEGSACAAEPSREQPANEDASWMANLRQPEIPVRPHERVRQYVEYFTQNSDGRRVFRGWLKRSGRYSKTVSATLREMLLPQDLQAVVFVESGYSPKAVSTAGAVGLWQLMASTARIYGLAVESDLDERRSVERASQAAVKHLSDMRDRFGSWELALAAYNMGYKGLVDRIKDVSTNDFWTLSELEGVLPRETQLYVPKVLAASLILRNLDRFGFDDTRIDPPLATTDLEVPAGTNLSLVARAAGTSVKMLRELNPELLSDNVPDRARVFAVHIPSSGAGRAQSLLPRLLDQRDREGGQEAAGDDFDWGRDETKRISSRRRMDFFDDNGGEPARRAQRFPRGLGRADGDEESAPGAAGKANVILYRVGESESVTSIAKTFGTTPGQIIEDNYLDPDGKLQRGMLLIVEASPRNMQRIMKKRAQSRFDAAGEQRDAREPRELREPDGDARSDLRNTGTKG